MKKRKAFPSHGSNGSDLGMDLKDYFAAKALNGIMSNQKIVDTLYLGYKDGETDEVNAGLSEICYQIANSMLKEREKHDD